MGSETGLEEWSGLQGPQTSASSQVQLGEERSTHLSPDNTESVKADPKQADGSKMDERLVESVEVADHRDEQDSHAVSKINEWFKLNGKAELRQWTKYHVVDFFVDIDEHDISAKMLHANMTGPLLFKFFLTYDKRAAEKYGIDSKTKWKDMKFDLWNSLVMNKHGNPILPEDEKAQKSCEQKKALKGFFCGEFELSYVWGLEWILFKLGEPFSFVPNPIHTFICSPRVWKAYVPWKEFKTGDDGNANMLTNVLASIANWITRLASTLVGGLFNLLETAVKCGICTLCVIWEKITSKAEELWRKVKAGGRSIRKAIFQEDTTGNRYKAADRIASLAGADADDISEKTEQFWTDTQSGLMELFSGGTGEHRLRRMWNEKVSLQRGNRSFTHAEIEQIVTAAENHTASAVRLIEEARAASFERLGDHMKSQWEPRVAAHSTQRKTFSSTSFGSSESSLVEASLVAAGHPGIPVKDENVPQHCLEVMDQKNHLKVFRRSWQIAINIEEPSLGKAWSAFTGGNLYGAIQACVPELLVMIIPRKKDYGDCLTIPEEIRGANAQKCTQRHIGMCMVSTKHQLLKKVIEQDWPPMEAPNWFTRAHIRRSLQNSIARKPRHDHKASEDERHQLDLDAQDRLELSKLIKTWDEDEDEQPLYTIMIWYASIRAWRELALSNINSAELVDVVVGNSHDLPNVEPFILQFCHAMLMCKLVQNESVYSHERFVQSFDKKQEQHVSTNVRAGLVARNDMYKFWLDTLKSTKPLFAKADFDALDNLQDVYENDMSPLMTKAIDLRADPFQRPLSFQPHLANVHSVDISHDLRELWDPILAGSASMLRQTKEAYVWIDVNEVQGCPRLHIVFTCGNECFGCTVHPLPPESNQADVLLNRTGTCQQTKNQRRCETCLSQHIVQHIISCSDGTAADFYSVDHPTQKASLEGRPPVNKYAVLHTFREELAEKQIRVGSLFRTLDFPFKRQSVDFKDVAGIKKQMILRELFSTIQQAGKCYCACKALRDVTQQGCVDVIRPTAYKSDPKATWCLPPTSVVPGAFCCSTTNKPSEPIPRAISVFSSQYGCVTPGRLRRARAMCRKNGHELCNKQASIKLANNLQRHNRSLARQLSRLLEMKPSDALRALAPCLLTDESGSIANVPFLDTNFMVWVAGADGHIVQRPRRSLKRQTYFHDGSLSYEFHSCINAGKR